VRALAALAGAALLFAGQGSRAQASLCHLAEAPGGTGVRVAPTQLGGDDITISVAALYTPEAADSAIGRGQPIETWIASGFANWQLVLDSARGAGPRIVVEPRGVIELDVPETGACFPDLDAFRAHPLAAGIRDSLQANLMLLFTARCSAAYQCTPQSDCEAFAYATARFFDAGLNPATGGHAVAHEAGHLLGMRHDILSDPTPGYNHGYRDDVGGFYTVMAFRGPLPPANVVSAYSDPLRLYDGRPLGNVDEADNARVLRENAPIAATWNQDTATEPGPSASAIALRAFPNPARGAWQVEIEAPPDALMMLELIDARGRRVWSLDQGVARSAAAPSAGLAPGTYLLRATPAGTAHGPSASITLTIAR
jgi:hypothetical protein